MLGVDVNCCLVPSAHRNVVDIYSTMNDLKRKNASLGPYTTLRSAVLRLRFYSVTVCTGGVLDSSEALYNVKTKPSAIGRLILECLNSLSYTSMLTLITYNQNEGGLILLYRRLLGANIMCFV